MNLFGLRIKKIPYNTKPPICGEPRRTIRFCPRQESNLHLLLRREMFYPLYYGDKIFFVVQAACHPKIHHRRELPRRSPTVSSERSGLRPSSGSVGADA